MNILFFYPTGFDPQCGGTEKVMETLSNCFARDGHCVFYASIHKATDYIAPFPHLVLDNAKWSALNSVRINLLSSFVREHNIDIIIDNYHHNKLKYLKMIASVKKQTGVKVVTLYHTAPTGHELRWTRIKEDEWLRTPRKKRLKECILGRKLIAKLEHKQTSKALQLRLKHFDKLVLLSKYFIPEAMELSGISSSDKYAAIPNPVGSLKDTTQSETKMDELLWVGRMASLKRPEKALKVWLEIQDAFPDWEINFVGDGEMYGALQEISSQLGKRCHLLGYQNSTPYYETAKIFLMTSDFEGFPLVLVESQRHGVVPIAFNNFASIKDIIVEGKTGIIVPTNDLVTYKQQLTELMRNEEKLKDLSEKARQHSNLFTKENIIPMWYDLFNSLGLSPEK